MSEDALREAVKNCSRCCVCGGDDVESVFRVDAGLRGAKAGNCFSIVMCPDCAELFYRKLEEVLPVVIEGYIGHVPFDIWREGK